MEKALAASNYSRMKDQKLSKPPTQNIKQKEARIQKILPDANLKIIKFVQYNSDYVTSSN